MPEGKPAPTYDEYFAQVVDYGYPDGEDCKVSSGCNISGYTLAYEAPALYLEVCDSIARDPELWDKYFTEGFDWVNLTGHIEFERHISKYTVCYYNAFTGEYLEQFAGGYSNPGGAWWNVGQCGG